MYRIEFSSRADKQFAKLESQIQERIVRALKRSALRPKSYFERLRGDYLYKLRVGDYRIIARIEEDKLFIFVIEVGHRKNVYDR